MEGLEEILVFIVFNKIKGMKKIFSKLLTGYIDMIPTILPTVTVFTSIYMTATSENNILDNLRVAIPIISTTVVLWPFVIPFYSYIKYKEYTGTEYSYKYTVSYNTPNKKD